MPVKYRYEKGVYIPYLTNEIRSSGISTNIDYVISSDSWTDVYMTSTLSQGDQTTLNTVVSNHDRAASEEEAKTTQDTINLSDSTLSSFVDTNSVVTDTSTGISGPYWLMELLNHRKELYNDNTNPVYDPNHTPILGSTGILQDHADRVNNLEVIHGKLGWHHQEVTKATYSRPTDVLFYYGWLNSFNSAENQWSNEKVAQDMSKYGLIILGNGVQDPTHGDYANTQVIVSRIKALNPSSLIFGYVSVNQAINDFKTKVNQWDTLQVHGIFLDEAGYDYGKTRPEFNERVNYVHDTTNCTVAFANAWNLDHIIGTANDVSYPNSTYNDTSVASNLITSDWALLESFPVNTTAYSGGGVESKTDWAARGSKAITLRSTYGINLSSANIISNDSTIGTTLSNFSFISSLMWSLEGHGTSDTAYGASSAAVKYWARPDALGLGNPWSLNPSVQTDAVDSDIYHRYCENSKLSLDFSSGDQTCYITRW